MGGTAFSKPQFLQNRSKDPSNEPDSTALARGCEQRGFEGQEIIRRDRKQRVESGDIMRIRKGERALLDS